jgi:hypothetical protein
MYLNTPADLYSTPHKGWIFENNYVYNCLSSTIGILLLNPNYPTDATPRLDAIIQNNVFRGNSIDNTGLSYLAEFEGVRGVRFAGNFIDVTQNGLILGSNYKCRDIEVYDNTFKDVAGLDGVAVRIARVDQLTLNNNIFDHVSPAGSGGYVTRFVNAFSSLPTPAGLVVTPSNSGGTLTAAHGAYGYRVAAFLDDGSTTVACAEVTGTIASGTAGKNVLTWVPVYGAKGYNVFGRTVGGELLMTPTGIAATATPTFTDTGSVTPSGALPAASSANGHSSGVAFTNNTVRQGSSNNTGSISNLVAGHVTQPNTLSYWGNQIPGNAALPIAPFTARQNAYTVTTAALTVDASLVPDGGTVVMTTSTSSAAGALTVSNGVIGQVITFIFKIAGTSFTYALASNMKIAGAALTHSTTSGYADCITFCFDGTNWNETARALAVH